MVLQRILWCLAQLIFGRNTKSVASRLMAIDNGAMQIPKFIVTDVALAPLTTLEVGGGARYFVEANDTHSARAALVWAAENGVRPFVLGSGSNLLVSDDGFDGLVLKFSRNGWVVSPDGKGVVTAWAGQDWSDFVKWSIGANFAGIECLGGIPGKVGAVPIQNVGAYGQEAGQVISGVEVLDLTTMESRWWQADECEFGYRMSRFKSEAGRHLVTRVRFRLVPNGEPTVAYQELVGILGPQPSLQDTYEGVLALRRRKSMVLDPHDENRRSAGSFFVNPVLSQAEFVRLQEKLPHLGLEPSEMPSWSQGEAYQKIPAAWLIQNAGFHKGHREGRVGLSSAHTLAIVNFGGATAREIVNFALQVRSRVRAIFGVQLVPEPIRLGFEPDPFNVAVDLHSADSN